MLFTRASISFPFDMAMMFVLLPRENFTISFPVSTVTFGSIDAVSAPGRFSASYLVSARSCTPLL